jgi:hypothetical protein
VVKPTAPERYRVQFTIGQETREKVRRLQALLRREVPDGDPGVLFDRAITVLLAQVEKRKLGLTAKPRSARPPIRPGTDSFDIRTRRPGAIGNRRDRRRADPKSRPQADLSGQPSRDRLGRLDLKAAPRSSFAPTAGGSTPS